MKIQKVHIANFRNIENIEHSIEGANILLVGENMRGKSNFIKAIETALGITSYANIDPIMHGKDEANIEVIMGENGEEYKFEVHYQKDRERPIVTVTTPDGMMTRSKSAIGSIVGEIDFDIDEFVDMSDSDKGRKDQVEIVKSFLDEETREAIGKHEQYVVDLFDQRTELNRKVKTVSGFISQSRVEPHEIVKYIDPVDVNDITSRLNVAIENNSKRSKGISHIESQSSTIKINLETIEKLKQEILECKKSIKKVDEWLSDNPEIDKDAIMEELQNANDHNAKHQVVSNVISQQGYLKELQEESDSLTVLIETAREAINSTIKELDTPVEGLSFDMDQLTYFDKPVNKATLSTSEIMMLGAKLKIAKNPNAHVLFIQRGESLGTEKLRDLQQMAKDYDFQIIMEQMERGKEKLEIQFMTEI